jgi:hypothetical protein
VVHYIDIPDRYDNFNEAGNWAQDSIAYVLQEFFGVPSYPKTAFNVIRLSMYQGRAMVVVSSIAATNLAMRTSISFNWTGPSI